MTFSSRAGRSSLLGSSLRGALPASLSALSLLALSSLAGAQTVVTAPAAPNGTVAAVPAGPKQIGTPVIVAAAVDTSGDAATAKRALLVANAALKATPGYAPMAVSDYAPLSKGNAAASMKGADWKWPFTASDYQKIGKASAAPCAMTISVTPLGDGTYSAVAEIMRTKDGALIGYGKGTSSAAEAPAPDLGAPAATTDTDANPALDSAVLSAVTALGETAVIPGIVVSKPEGYLARLSLGTLSGARGGARIEYLGEGDEPIAFGTIVDIAAGESVATVAPERAYPGLFVNQRVRLVTNPSAKRATPTFAQLQDKDYKEFERSFALSAGLATAVYYLAIR